MYGSHVTGHKRDAARDRALGRFTEDGRSVRAFDVVSEHGFSAIVDSDTSDDDQVFVWTGCWPERPVSLEAPPIEIAVAGSPADLRRRRSFDPVPRHRVGAVPMLRSRRGEVVAFEEVSAPSFSRAWVGGTDGAFIGVFCRSDTESNVTIVELDDVSLLLKNWRDLVDQGARG